MIKRKAAWLVLLMLLACSGYGQETEILVKANVIRGESMVTAQMLPADIESIFETQLPHFQYSSSPPRYLMVDVFVYQFPANNPRVAVTIRSEKGIHYAALKHQSLFLNRKKAHEKLAQKLVEDLPETIGLSRNIELSTGQLLYSQNRADLVFQSSKTISGAFRSNYAIKLNWNGQAPLPFMLNDFNEYFHYCIDFGSLRTKVKQHGSLKLKLRINANGHTFIEEHQAPFELSWAEKNSLQEAVAAIPIWLTLEEVSDISLTIGLK